MTRHSMLDPKMAAQLAASCHLDPNLSDDMLRSIDLTLHDFYNNNIISESTSLSFE